MNAVVIDKNLIESYSGGNYDRLTDESKMLTATAWNQYPGASFDNLVEKVKGMNTEWANLIADQGVNYFVLAQGDTFCASGCLVNEHIACDIEEWYSDIGKSKFIATSDNFDEEWNELTEFIEQFGLEICQGVTAA